MSKRYQAYTRLKLDYPSKRILRITFDRPETYNSVDAETHTQLTNIWRDINRDPFVHDGAGGSLLTEPCQQASPICSLGTTS